MPEAYGYQGTLGGRHMLAATKVTLPVSSAMDPEALSEVIPTLEIPRLCKIASTLRYVGVTLEGTATSSSPRGRLRDS
jgi:hypothetical protein